MAASKDERPNNNTTLLLMCFPTKNILKILFSKWTTAVKAMEISSGKKTANTGKRRVPNPNPEKKVSADPSNAVNAIIINSILGCCPCSSQKP